MILKKRLKDTVRSQQDQVQQLQTKVQNTRINLNYLLGGVLVVFGIAIGICGAWVANDNYALGVIAIVVATVLCLCGLVAGTSK